MKLKPLSKEQLIADITHAEEKAKTLCGPCADDHARLACWLRSILAVHEQEPFGYVSEKCANAQGQLKTAMWELFRKPTEIGQLKFKNPLYTQPMPSIPSAVPEEIPDSVYQVIYQECGGFVDCAANAQTIWSACRAAMLQSGGASVPHGQK